MNTKPVDILLERAGRILNGTEDTLEDWRDAVELLERAAQLGSKKALFELGNFYRFGEFTKKSPVKAIGFFKKAAAGYYVPAYVGLICTYLDDFKDKNNALKIFRIIIKDIRSEKIKMPMSDEDCEWIHIMAFHLLLDCLGYFDEEDLFMLRPQIIRGVKVLDARSKYDDGCYFEDNAFSITLVAHWLHLNMVKNAQHLVEQFGWEIFDHTSEANGIAKRFCELIGVSHEEHRRIAKKLLPADRYLKEV